MKDALGRVRSVLLLGGRSEIGLAVVSRLVDSGATKVVLAARAGVDDETLDQVRRPGVEVTSLDFDGGDPTTHPAFVQQAFDILGDVDVVLDAFGILGSNEQFESDPVYAAESTMINFGGHVSVGLLVAGRFKEQGHGTLVVLSSVAGVRVRKANYVYGATKAGLDGFATGLADALAGTGAGVLVIRPGFVFTQMTEGMSPAPMSVTPTQVAEAVADGLRKGGSGVVWVPAQLAAVFGVLRNLPRAVWRKLPR
jgi:decaprenylphospho-beta-D-erythro-pentofuranosid-2-ulose 2-reductase